MMVAPPICFELHALAQVGPATQVTSPWKQANPSTFFWDYKMDARSHSIRISDCAELNLGMVLCLVSLQVTSGWCTQRLPAFFTSQDPASAVYQSESLTYTLEGCTSWTSAEDTFKQGERF